MRVPLNIKCLGGFIESNQTLNTVTSKIDRIMIIGLKFFLVGKNVEQ